MAKEILLYTSFNSYSVADFISALEANKGEDVCIRMNTPGGSVYDGYGAIAKYNEFTGKKQLKIDGRADSFGAYFVASTDPENVECLDVSTFTFHRAAMPSWMEADSRYFTDDAKAQLNTINDTLRGFIESKVTPETWKKVTGVSLDDMFSLDSRIDVPVTAEKMHKMGMVGTVNKITPKKLAEIKAYSLDLAAEYAPLVEADTTTSNTTTMEIKSLADFKAAHPALFAEAANEGVKAEKARVKAWQAFSAIDAKAVNEAIATDAVVDMTVIAEMSAKAVSNVGIKNIVEANAGEIKTPEAEAQKTAQAAAEEAFWNEATPKIK